MENEIKVLQEVVRKLDSKIEKIKADLPKFEGMNIAVNEILAKYSEFIMVSNQELLQLAAAGKIDPDVAQLVAQYVQRGHGKLNDKANELKQIVQLKQGEALGLSAEKNEIGVKISSLEQKIADIERDRQVAEEMAENLIKAAQAEVTKEPRKTRLKKSTK